MDIETQRKLTEYFISLYPETVTFIPRTKTRTSTGGFVFVEGSPRAPQVVTFIEPGPNPVPTVTLDGINREVEFEVLGKHDAAMARHDVFNHQGKEWEVIDLFYDNGYETRALVSGRG